MKSSNMIRRFCNNNFNKVVNPFDKMKYISAKDFKDVKKLKIEETEIPV